MLTNAEQFSETKETTLSIDKGTLGPSENRMTNRVPRAAGDYIQQPKQNGKNLRDRFLKNAQVFAYV